MKGNDEIEWNESIGMEMEKSVIELVERKNGMEIDVKEWIESMETNYNKK